MRPAAYPRKATTANKCRLRSRVPQFSQQRPTKPGKPCAQGNPDGVRCPWDLNPPRLAVFQEAEAIAPTTALMSATLRCSASELALRASCTTASHRRLYAITLTASRAHRLLEQEEATRCQHIIDDVLQLATAGQSELRAILTNIHARPTHVGRTYRRAANSRRRRAGTRSVLTFACHSQTSQMSQRRPRKH